jgi:uncharacterized protein (DUF433 family)
LDWHAHIHSDPAVLPGKPVIKGTRISVELILEELSNGKSVQDILTAFPHLMEGQVQAALAFAAEAMRQEESRTLASRAS